MKNDKDSDKSHPATEKKLQDSLKDGGGINITEPISALSALILLLYIYYSTIDGFEKAKSIYIIAIKDTKFCAKIAECTIPVFDTLILSLITLIATIYIATFAFLAPQKLWRPNFKITKLKLENISPLSNIKKKYSAKSLKNESIKILKLSIILTASVSVAASINTITPPHLSTHSFNSHLSKLTITTIASLQIILFIFSITNYLNEIFSFNKRIRMSTQEIKDEVKEDQGDPGIRQKRLNRAQELSRNSIPESIKLATIVVVNPTHYAVALSWRPESGDAPKCIVKGAGEIALKIKKLAKENNIPIIRDPKTARSLFKKVNENERIKREHYAAISAALRSIIKPQDRE